MGFRFRFETVLTVKTRKEEEKRFELLAEEQRMQAKALELNRYENAHQESLDMLTAASQGQVDLEYLSICYAYANHLKQRQDNCRDELHKAQMDVSRVRQELVDARKETKAMEQLKERDYREYLREEQSKEQKFLDELGVNGHNRKRG